MWIQVLGLFSGSWFLGIWMHYYAIIFKKSKKKKELSVSSLRWRQKKINKSTFLASRWLK